MLLSTGHSHHWYMNVLTSQSHTTYLSISPSSLKEGDRNTKFFHRIANSHRRCNTIDRLMVDEELSTDQGIIEGCITHFYRQLYSKNEVHRPLLDEVVFSRISKMPLGWTALLMRKKYLGWSMISMVIKRQAQMVLQWHFSNPIGAW